MKKILYKTAAATAAIVIVGFLSACDDFLTEANPNQTQASTFFSDEEAATQAINGAYATLQRHNLYKRQFSTIAFWGGDLVPTTSGANWGEHLYNFTLDANTSDLPADVYPDLYLGVARANLVLEGVSEMTESQINADLKKRILGEAHWLRGFYYFNLVTMYGEGVPIIDHTVTSSDDPAFMPGNSKLGEVWAFIESEFTLAAADLPSFETYTDLNVGRVSKGAAQAYLGKSHLYQEEWTEAVAAFKPLVENLNGAYGSYGLLSGADYNQNFNNDNENNIESVFEVQFKKGFGGPWNGDDNDVNSEGNMFSWHMGGHNWVFGNGAPSEDVVRFFQENTTGSDIRFSATMQQPTWQGAWLPQVTAIATDNYSIIKHIDYDDSYLDSDWNWRVMRWADVLLMYAEALNEAGQTSMAIGFINDVRLRAGAEVITATTQAEVRDAIKTERRLELTYEYSRFFDVVRWGDAEAEWGSRGFSANKNAILPIPSREITINPNLKQNPGY